MTKHALLEHLADMRSADAMDVADTFGITYAAAAMQLLRLTRQGLLHRYISADEGHYFYELSERGHARLEFFQSHH
jgi:predicted ArsR family transcriptional regulator